jgi:hypothetical protein
MYLAICKIFARYAFHIFRNRQIDGSLGTFMSILKLKYLGRKGMFTLCVTLY